MQFYLNLFLSYSGWVKSIAFVFLFDSKQKVKCSGCKVRRTLFCHGRLLSSIASADAARGSRMISAPARLPLRVLLKSAPKQCSKRVLQKRAPWECSKRCPKRVIKIVLATFIQYSFLFLYWQMKALNIFCLTELRKIQGFRIRYVF